MSEMRDIAEALLISRLLARMAEGEDDTRPQTEAEQIKRRIEALERMAWPTEPTEQWR